jgi:hypothetical protein
VVVGWAIGARRGRVGCARRAVSSPQQQTQKKPENSDLNGLTEGMGIKGVGSSSRLGH